MPPKKKLIRKKKTSARSSGRKSSWRANYEDIGTSGGSNGKRTFSSRFWHHGRTYERQTFFKTLPPHRKNNHYSEDTTPKSFSGLYGSGPIKRLYSPLPQLKFNNLTSMRVFEENQSPRACKIVVIKKATNNIIDNAGVKRILSPFNRFANNGTRTAETTINCSRMAYQSHFKPTGLSTKEKAYVICSCQSRSVRYTKIKSLAANAIRDNKIFTICGCCNPIRRALLERGWIEKITPNKMNLSRIRNGSFSNKNDLFTELERLLLSNLVEKCSPNFIWQTKQENNENFVIDLSKEHKTLINKLKTDALWTSKQGLCSSMKMNYWFYIENVAEVNLPRTYNSYDTGEIEGFINDYQITACTSLLKWIISMVANERPIFVETGKISMAVMVFALNRCKEYLFRKENKDIDRTLSSISTSQWRSFMKKYYRIIEKYDVFTSDKDNKLPLYLRYSKFLLKEIHKYRPQLSCEGCHNIWIIKPAHCSRGRGIRMASKLAVITNLLNKANTKYVVQKYIEDPLLIHDTKFDIRQYYLVTSTYPLVIWMYKDCYFKFSSQKYNLNNYHESIHLTNYAVQRNYKNAKDRHRELPKNNMWDLEKYKQYLNLMGRNKVWDNIIYPGMTKSIIGIMLSCQDSLSLSKNRFELYGCDFILDNEYKPWLIEINSCPDLNPTTNITANICPAVLSDLIKVVIDYASNSKSPTGKFECIYRQPMTMPKYGGASQLFIQGFALRNEYFYKGNIEINESYHDIEKEHDMTSILNKLKNYSDSTDIMKEPDDDSGCYTKKEICTQNTESDYELSRAASAITGQLEELIDRITSEHTRSVTSIPHVEDFTFLSAIGSQIQTPAVKSEMDIKSLLLKSSGSRFASVEALNTKRHFKFSKLDDGPSRKDSCQTIGSIKKTLNQSSNILNLNVKGEEFMPKSSRTNLLEETTMRIMSFIREKEKEYLNEYRYPNKP